MIDLGKWAFENKKLVYFLIAVLLAGGIYSVYDMGKLEDPEIKIKMAMIVVTRPGASAHEMELEVVDPLEKAIRTIDNVDAVYSWSYNDKAVLQVDLLRTVDDEILEQSWDMLRRKVNDVLPSLPNGTDIIVQDDFNLVYGMLYALTGDGLSENELEDYAMFVQRELSALDGVARVQLYGMRERTIDITLSPEKMASLGVAPAEVLSVLQGQNGLYYTGYYDNGPNRVRVTVNDRFRTVEQIGQMIIQGHENDQLRLCDIATVTEGYVTPVRNSMIHNGSPALGIAVAAASGTDILKVGKRVSRCLENLENEYFPAGMECEVIFYQPERVTEALTTFFVNLLESVAIVIVILMFTMGFKSGMIIGISLITIVMGSFLLLGMSDGTMQRISLATFVLAMGMLVDNAIVIIDGILVDLQKGKNRYEAMTSIGRKTAMPLLGATLIAVFAFLPVFLSPDTAGVYVRDLFIVMAVSLILSWILALTHVPLMADSWLKKQSVSDESTLYDSGVYRMLRAILSFGLRHRLSFVFIAVVLVGISIFGMRFVKKGFFPDMTYNQLYMEYKLPEGTNSTRVADDLKAIALWLHSRSEITDVTISVGATPARYNLVRSVATPSLSYGELIISFTSPKTLDENMNEIQNELSTRYPDAYVKLKKYNIMYKKYPIEAQFIGPDPAVLHALADSARMIMQNAPEICHITTDWEPAVAVLEADYNQLTARRAGFSRQDISTSLLMASGGMPVGYFYEGRHKNTIYLKCAEPDGESIDNLGNVPIFSTLPNLSGLLDDEIMSKVKSGKISRRELTEKLLQTLPLEQLGNGISIRWEDPVIPRYNGQRAQKVMCSPVPGMETEEARLAIADKIENLHLPTGYSLRWEGEKDASVQTMLYLFKQVPLGVVLIVAVLILLFGDYRKPTIIICCVPLLIIGVVCAMLMSGLTFTFCAIVGVLGLVGMLIKNCIVLMDEIDRQMKISGTDPVTALIESSCSRLRSVMMASLTTILGMIPLLSDDLFGPMAATIMGGLLFSTVATLIYLPIFYAMFFKIKKR